MPEAPRVKRHVLPPRARTAVRIAVTAVALGVLALVIGVVANILHPAKVIQERPVPAAVSAPGQADYTAGLAALSSGDATKAAELLGKAAAAGNTAAKAKLAQVAKSGSGASAVTTGALDAPMSDMTVLLPASVSGYDLAEVETSTIGAILSGEPNDAGPKGTVRVTVFSVLDRKTAAGAKAWLEEFTQAFPRNVAAVKVGSIPAKFGTDTARSASVAFIRGRYAFEVVSTAVRGDAGALKSLVMQAAAAFPAAR